MFNRAIDIRLVYQTMGGALILSWHKLRKYVADVRRELARESMHEWYQWLVEHLETLEREEGRSVAYAREKEWRP